MHSDIVGTVSQAQTGQVGFKSYLTTLDNNGDGLVTYGELTEHVNLDGYTPPANAPVYDAGDITWTTDAPLVTYLMSQLHDENADGKIDESETVAILSLFGYTVDGARDLYTEKAYIPMAELEEAIRVKLTVSTQEPGVSASFWDYLADHDENSDGVVTLKELIARLNVLRRGASYQEIVESDYIGTGTGQYAEDYDWLNTDGAHTADYALITRLFMDHHDNIDTYVGAYALFNALDIPHVVDEVEMLSSVTKKGQHGVTGDLVR